MYSVREQYFAIKKCYLQVASSRDSLHTSDPCLIIILILIKTRKRLHKHGGSHAIDLPANFVKRLRSEYVSIEQSSDSLIIPSVDPLSCMEEDSLFLQFIETIRSDALRHPEKLQAIEKVWDDEWNDLLKGVDGGQE